MARTKKRSRKTTRKKAKFHSFIALYKSERTHFLTGVVVAFIGLFILMAMLSFFFTGAADQSKIDNKAFFQLITEKGISVENWTGAGGAFIAEYLINKWFGIFSLLIPFFFIIVGLRWMNVSRISLIKTFFLTAAGIIFGSVIAAFVGKFLSSSHIHWGGNHGLQMEQLLESTIGVPGIVLVILLFIIAVTVIFRKSSMYKIQDTLNKRIPTFSHDENINTLPFDEIEHNFEKKRPNLWKRFFAFVRKKREKDVSERGSDEIDTSMKQEVENTLSSKNNETDTSQNDFEIIVPKEEEFTPQTNVAKAGEKEQATESEESVPLETAEILDDYDPKKDLSAFQFPSMELLKAYSSGSTEVNMVEQNQNKDKIIRTLRNYGIEITSIKATVGPTITLYEIIPQAGVRISKIKNLEDDIALSLSALGIRIIAPMPGKGTIGIEVPNKDPQIVSMQSVIASKRFQECSYELPVALGKTITNEIFMFDLCKMPHLLVAGATGQGKSVGLNAIITSLLYKKHPSEMKMVLVDPKMVEFNIYSTIEKHYLAKLPDEEKAIITDVSKVTQTLNSLTKEMDDRYELLMRAHVRNIKEYNDKFVKRRLNPNKGHRYLPYIVVVIDEFGDLIMTAGKEIEMPIARIAQKARAVGMHMVIATQRPTTNIITGTIKANFPARMAFRVTSQIDSRTILDMNGANQLIGRGDMLFSQGSNLIRIQCAFVDTPEVEEITQYIGKQRGYETAFFLPEFLSNEGEEKKPGAVDLNDRDPLFEEAARLIVVHQQGSTSLIQRKFSIGYNRAGRLMDQIEAAGIVGSIQGSKPRDVYIADEYSLEKILSELE